MTRDETTDGNARSNSKNVSMDKELKKQPQIAIALMAVLCLLYSSGLALAAGVVGHQRISIYQHVSPQTITASKRRGVFSRATSSQNCFKT